MWLPLAVHACESSCRTSSQWLWPQVADRHNTATAITTTVTNDQHPSLVISRTGQRGRKGMPTFFSYAYSYPLQVRTISTQCRTKIFVASTVKITSYRIGWLSWYRMDTAMATRLIWKGKVRTFKIYFTHIFFLSFPSLHEDDDDDDDGQTHTVPQNLAGASNWTRALMADGFGIDRIRWAVVG